MAHTSFMLLASIPRTTGELLAGTCIDLDAAEELLNVCVAILPLVLVVSISMVQRRAQYLQVKVVPSIRSDANAC